MKACRAETVGVIWIDTEGFEPQVVQGLGDFLGRVPLLIEYAPKRYAADDGARLRELLQQHYTTLYRLGPERAARSRFPRSLPSTASPTSWCFSNAGRGNR